MQVRRYAKRSFSALRLQCTWRRFAARRSFETRVNALDLIQRSMRRMLGALAFERERQRRENEVRLTCPQNVSAPPFVHSRVRSQAIHEVAESTVAVSNGNSRPLACAHLTAPRPCGCRVPEDEGGQARVETNAQSSQGGTQAAKRVGRRATPHPANQGRFRNDRPVGMCETDSYRPC